YLDQTDCWTTIGWFSLIAMRPPLGTQPSYLPVAPATIAPAAAPPAAPITVDFVWCPKICPAIAPITAPVATFLASLLASPLRTFSTCADVTVELIGYVLPLNAIDLTTNSISMLSFAFSLRLSEVISITAVAPAGIAAP